jgi:hypothetical protein
MPEHTRDKDTLDLKTNLERKIWLRKKAIAQRLNPYQGERKCILIPGMQRSGSKLLIALLEWSKYTDCYPEDDRRAFDHFQMRNTDRILYLRSRSRAEHFAIKCLCETDQTYLLLDRFAPAKAIWILRDFRDCVNSCVRNFSGFADRTHRIAGDRNSAGWRGRGMSDETWEIIRRLDHENMNEDTGAALQWYYRNIFFFEQQLDQDERVMLVKYEDLVTNPMATVSGIFEFTGIRGMSPWIVRKIHSRSLGKNASPDIAQPVLELCNSLQDRFNAVAARSEAAGSASRQ